MTFAHSRPKLPDGCFSTRTLLLFLLAVAPWFRSQAAAQTFTELYPFNSSGTLADGGTPEAGVVRDSAGNFYGTTFYMMLNSDSQNFSYAESIDGLTWTNTVFLGMLGQVPNLAGYAMPIGTGIDPATLGKEFYVYYTQFRGPWPGGQSVKRFTLTCR